MYLKEATPSTELLGVTDLVSDSDFTDVDTAPSSIDSVSSGSSGKFVPIPSFDQMILDEIEEMFTKDVNIETPERAAARLLRRLLYQVVEHNSDPDTKKRRRTEFCWPTVHTLPPIAIAHLIMHFYHVRVVIAEDVSLVDNTDSGLLAIYIDDEGIYSSAPDVLENIILRFNSTISAVDERLTEKRLKALAPRQCPEQTLIPLANGFFDPRTKELSPFTPDVVFDSKFAVNFVPDPPLPVYEPTGQSAFEMLTAPWPDDCVKDNFQGLFWQIYRSIFTGSKGKIIHLTGSPRTGKSVQIDIWQALVGAASVELSLSEAAGRFGRGDIVGKRLLFDAEMGGRAHLEAAIIKKIATGDVLTIERKHRDAFRYRPRALWAMAGNAGSMSSFDDKSMGVTDRFLHIPFETVMSNDRDGGAKEFLTSGPVLEWATYHALVDTPDFSTYEEPVSVLRTGGAVNAETMEMPHFLAWLEDDSRAAFNVMSTDFLPRAWLYDMYITYLETTAPAASPMKLGKLLEALHPYLDSEVWDRAGDARAYVAPDVWRMENYRPVDVDKFPRGQAGARFLGGQQRGFKRRAGEAFPSSSVLKNVKIKIHNPDGSADVEFTTLDTFTYSNIHVVLDNPEAVAEIAYSPVPLSEETLRRLVFPFGFASHKPVERRIKYQDKIHVFTSRKPQ